MSGGLGLSQFDHLPIKLAHRLLDAQEMTAYLLAMGTFIIGHWLANLLIPGDPDKVTIQTPAGDWELSKAPRFAEAKDAVENKGMVGETYAISHLGSCTGSRSAAMDRAGTDLIPICLGASYTTGLSVAPNRSLPMSEVGFIQVGTHYPRVRGISSGFPTASTEAEFVRQS